MSADSTGGSSGAKSSNKGKRLRRPRPETQERLRKGDFDPEENVPNMKSTLSANAPEFIPKYALVYPEQNASQDALYQDFQRLVSVRPSHLSSGGGGSSNNVAEVFKDAVFSLTSNPGPTEEYVMRVVDMLNANTPEPSVINEMIETLFEQSITESNFRFTGAKICKLLCKGLINHPTLAGFRGLYLNRCKKEFDLREQLLVTDVNRLCGLAMYFGELFLVLEVESNGIPSKIGILRGAIADLLTTLLSRPDDITVKCAMQLLKLTGTAIMETTDLPGSFDDTFAKTKSLEKHPSLNKTSHCLINSVLSRLEYNFGVDQQPSPQKPQQSPNTSYNSSFNNEPVFYNEQGQPISREEAGYYGDDTDGLFDGGMNSEAQEAYLQWQAENYANQQQWAPSDQAGDGQWGSEPWSTGMSDYAQWSTDQGQGYAGYDDGGDYYSDYSNDMDDEMAAAYEMFLKESGQTRH